MRSKNPKTFFKPAWSVPLLRVLEKPCRVFCFERCNLWRKSGLTFWARCDSKVGLLGHFISHSKKDGLWPKSLTFWLILLYFKVSCQLNYEQVEWLSYEALYRSDQCHGLFYRLLRPRLRRWFRRKVICMGEWSSGSGSRRYRNWSGTWSHNRGSWRGKPYLADFF